MKTTTFLAIAFSAIMLFSASKPNESLVLDGKRLYADVEKYVSFGDHRTGTPANTLTADWLGEELSKYGYTVQYPEFPLRQYFFYKGAIVSDSDSVSVFPQWWVNENISQSVEGRLVELGPSSVQTDLKGKIALIHAPEGEVLQAFQLINSLSDNGAVAVVVITENPSGDVAAFNSPAKPNPWKIPVALAASKYSEKLAGFASKQRPVRLYIAGEYKEVKGRNVYGTIGTGKKYVVISTPISGWFICGGERGPGIAVWLELARWAANLKATDYTFVFTGNSGHEIGGIGAHQFLDQFAPAVDDTHLWIHLGAGLATHAYKQTPTGLVKQAEVDSLRNFFYSDPVESSFKSAFANAKAQKYNTKERNAGELIYVANKGYKRILGISYIHPFFHTPQDSASATSPQLLEDITRNYQQFISQELKK
ncbi:M28 family metallopeptidase [Viscerimonas tarda]